MLGRSSGVLMHISSLPNDTGIGDFGKSAYEFIDFLKEAGQSLWQILPLGPTGYGDSPYQSFSSFAGNPYFINLDYLVEEGFLHLNDLSNLKEKNNIDVVDYGFIYKEKMSVLRKAFNNFLIFNAKGEIEVFKKENSYWLEDYSLYMALKKNFKDKIWLHWPKEYKDRDKNALKKIKDELKIEIEYQNFLQYEFYKQWKNLKKYANLKGIKIIGDIPIFVALDSSDIWANNDMFLLDKDKSPLKVSGCPPDAFSEDGQLWGNPLYDWSFLKKNSYSWWIERVRYSFNQYDIVRIDHFRGFESYWEIPADAVNAKNGKWQKGPGIDFFNTLERALGKKDIIAEDLGFLTPDVKMLLRKTKFPGMKVLLFAFDSEHESDYLPHKYDLNSIAYVGTHDNETVVGWYETVSLKDKKYCDEYLKTIKGVTSKEINWKFIEAAWSSKSVVAIAQIQDFLGLNNLARMNKPSTESGNWSWRLNKKLLTKELAKRMKKLTVDNSRKVDFDEKYNVKRNTLLEGSNMKLSVEDIKKGINKNLLQDFSTKLEYAEKHEIYQALTKTILDKISTNWVNTADKYQENKQVHYFSSEFLMGRAFGNNLINLGMMDNVKQAINELGIDYNIIEESEEDAGTGNGGLGRLAACFIESLATLNLPGIGYSIRYKNGIFNQKIENGYQVEYPETWLKYGDAWSIKKLGDEVIVNFKDFSVRAIPYDTPIFGYGTNNVNTLRLWEAAPMVDFNYSAFNAQDYNSALYEANRVEDISRILYPNDSTNEGKKLRLRQQYFFVSASLQDIVKKYKRVHGDDFSKFSNLTVIQLNDTHPTVAIPELMRILCEQERMSWYEAWAVVTKTFAYTNHTILAEALEKWWIGLYEEILPNIYNIIRRINEQLLGELRTIYPENVAKHHRMAIIQGDLIHMAWLAIYGSSYVNGVAALHTELLKHEELKEWYELYPEKFQNKTNGITQRRWLLLSNPELSKFITSLIGDTWIKDLTQLKRLEEYANDKDVLNKFIEIKSGKKYELANYLEKDQGEVINTSSIFDVQVKRLHEYKRQLLNIFHVIDLYNRLKHDPNIDMAPVTYIFGSKAAPGYRRAKGIIKLINEVAKKINDDPVISKKIKVVFVENYRVSLAHLIFPAADISEQISTAGKEASGTGNMKFMLNGGLTLGTLDGANIEIVEEAGAENNFIFGLTVEEINEIKKIGYNPLNYYNSVSGLKAVIDSLVDGTFDDNGKGYFRDIYNSLLYGTDWHQPDEYFVLKDFEAYRNIQKLANNAYKDREGWAKKAWLNIANAGKFSSDRTIAQYAKEIWDIKSVKI